jgi:hypothetical protein
VHPTSAPSAVDAATLAYVSAGVIGAAWLVALTQVTTGNAGVQSWLFLLVLPALVGLVHGAGLLRRQERRTPLVVSAVAAGAVLVATCLAGFVAYSDSAFVAFAAAPLLLVPLLAVTAALAGRAAPR